jgi:starvation-inducible DNA-binding protein
MKPNIGLNDNARKTSADALANVLADSYALYVKTQNFHWNVTGSDFGQLHEMFGAQYAELAGAIDGIAERIRALGQPAPGGLTSYAKLTLIKDAPSTPPAAKEMIRALLGDHETLTRRAREAKEVVEGVGDAESGDMMIERMQVHGKTAWMLRAMLEC